MGDEMIRPLELPEMMPTRLPQLNRFFAGLT